jgi:hypothetical protein
MKTLRARLDELEARARERQALRDGSVGVEWEPFPGSPQEQAYRSEADELFYGGAAGAGKSDLLLGLALTAHRQALIFRREYPQLKAIIARSRQLIGGKGSFNATDKLWKLRDGRTLEFGSIPHEHNKERFQGRPHDFLGFDELPHFTRGMFRWLRAWNRTEVPGQRCRIVCAGNPPASAEARWVVEEFAPWLDELHPAGPGELRWFSYADGEGIRWLRSPERVEARNPDTGKTEWVTPKSRTFIPGRVTDNPVLMQTGYRQQLEALPEPLRSQLLHGDFKAGMRDDEWQVIPTAWVKAAQARWTPHAPTGPPSALGVDVARGGDDKTVIARRHKTWFARLVKHPGSGTPDGPAVAGLIVKELAPWKDRRGRKTPVNIDVIGVGSSVYDQARQGGVDARAVNFGSGTSKTDRHGKIHFRNLRAWTYWHLREALDPDLGDGLALPPDPELLADLCAPRWKYTVSGVQGEAKEDIAKRLGRSPDCGDAVVLALLPGEAPAGRPYCLGR